jgi:hypothetical protein
MSTGVALMKTFFRQNQLICLVPMRGPLRWPAPWAFSQLILPLGIIVGFKSTPLPFSLAKAGVPVDQIASINSVVNLPGVFVFLWTPFVDIKLRRKTWLDCPVVRLMRMRFTKLLAGLFIISLVSVAQVQPLSGTPAARQWAAWLEVFNRGNREAYSEFLQKNFPSRVQRLDQHMDLRQRTGGFDVRKVETSTATEFVALVQERSSDQFVRLTLEVEATEPHHIIRMELQAIPAPAEFAPVHISEKELIVALRKKLEEETAADRFFGVALIAKNGKPVFAQAYGLADREHKTPNTLTTRFRIGSMNKMFTAVAILQPVQTGKLDLNGSLGKYLTDYPNKDVAAKVNISELLMHTGGTGDIFGPEFEAHRLELRSLQDYVKLYGNRAPTFEPGSRWEYSNYGFILLGVVIEKVSGESYYDYVREHIYMPAGMTSTGSEPEDQAVVDPALVT